ncbi:MAG: hypothetical protein J6P93_05075 [Alphaproteobacteria bacterium]|nr:hypothetical protein [Alphaproteobacteria bacterium]
MTDKANKFWEVSKKVVEEFKHDINEMVDGFKEFPKEFPKEMKEGFEEAKDIIKTTPAFVKENWKDLLKVYAAIAFMIGTVYGSAIAFESTEKCVENAKVHFAKKEVRYKKVDMAGTLEKAFPDFNEINKRIVAEKKFSTEKFAMLDAKVRE